MRCAPEKVDAFVRRPDKSLCAALVYGDDPILVSDLKRRLLRGILGDNASDGMYVNNLDPATVQRSAAEVVNAVTTQSMMPGRLAAVFEAATNRHTPAISRALAEPDPNNAFLLVTASDLRYNSSLRKLFESNPGAVALPAVAPEPTPQSMLARFRELGLPPASRDAGERLLTLAKELAWGEFESFLAKLATYMHGGGKEVTVGDVDACAPQSRAVEVDALVDAAAEGDTREVARLLRALADLGTSPVSILIPFTQQFLHMHRAYALSQGRNVDSLLFKQPMHPLRREALRKHIRSWQLPQLERALGELHETDIAIRFRNCLTQSALLERTLMRIATMAQRQRQRQRPPAAGTSRRARPPARRG